MRCLVLLIVALLGMTACQSKQPNAERPATHELLKAIETPPLINTTLPFIKGTWVQASYLDAVSHRKSPYQVRDTLAEVVELQVNPMAIGQDTLVVGVSLSNHEGGQVTLYFRQAHHPNALPVSFSGYESPANYYELGYSRTKSDTILHLNKYNRQHTLLTSVAYRHVILPARSDDTSAGLQYEVNRILLAGQYAGIDSSGRAIQASFTPAGLVRGFRSFRNYYISTDFAAGPENNLDVVTFDSNTSKQRSFAYRIAADSLYLYALLADSNHIELKPGRLHYSLKRR